MPLSEKVRIEIFIPDLPDPTYHSLLEELGDELSYAFGGCTVAQSSGKYRSVSGLILPDKTKILFTDTPFHLRKDRKIVILTAGYPLWTKGGFKRQQPPLMARVREWRGILTYRAGLFIRLI